MLKLTRKHIQALEAYEHTVTPDKEHVMTVVREVKDSVAASPRKRSDLLGLVDSYTMASFNTVNMKGEISLSKLIALAQVAELDPAFLAGAKGADACGYTEEAVRAFLAAYDMDFVLDDVGEKRDAVESLGDSEDVLWCRMLDVVGPAGMSEAEKTLVIARVLLKRVLGA